jgi:RNA polymerase sigma factor (sigma-70 family)
VHSDADRDPYMPSANASAVASVAIAPAPRDRWPAAAPAGEVAAATLEQFLSGISARAFRFAELGLRQREDALDAVQDAMMRMLGYRERPAAEWTPLFWSILRRRIVDLQRRSAFRLRWLQPAPAHADGDVSVDWVDEGPDPSRHQDNREAYARMAAALSALPRRQREAFSLRVLEELDVAQTAQAMGCSEGSVKTHLSRARETLKRQLEDFR